MRGLLGSGSAVKSQGSLGSAYTINTYLVYFCQGSSEDGLLGPSFWFLRCFFPIDYEYIYEEESFKRWERDNWQSRQ